MPDAGLTGVSADKDRKYRDKDLHTLRTTSFPAAFSTRVDMRRVNLTVFRGWVTDRVVAALGFEDDIVIEYVFDMLENDQYPDPRHVQISLTGFLEKHTPAFMEELWGLLVQAQDSEMGIPPQWLEQKKKEILAKREQDDNRARERDEIRRGYADAEYKRNDRGRGRGRGRGGRGRGRGGYRDDRRGYIDDRKYDRRSRSRSPDYRRRSPEYSRRSPSPPTPRRDRGESRTPEYKGRYSHQRSMSRSPSPSRYRSPSPRQRYGSDTPPMRNRGRDYSP